MKRLALEGREDGQERFGKDKQARSKESTPRSLYYIYVHGFSILRV